MLVEEDTLIKEEVKPVPDTDKIPPLADDIKDVFLDREQRLDILTELENFAKKHPQKILNILIELAKDDPDPFVKRQAWEASKNILDSVLPDGTSAGSQVNVKTQLAVFSTFLTALKEDDDQDDWEVRRAAADWLSDKSEVITRNKMGVDALRALLDRADKEEDLNVLRSTVKASERIWDEGWKEKQYQPVLYQVLKASDSNNWHVRQSSAEWLKRNADEITGHDIVMMANALSTLSERADDENDNVRRSMIEASKSLWNAGWEIDKMTVFRWVLQALSQGEENREGNDWELRQAAADWLGDKAEEIAAEPEPVILSSVINALVDQANDRHAEVRESVAQASRKIWNEALATRHAIVIRQVLRALEADDGDRDKDWEIRQAAADWLGDKASYLAKDQNILVEVINALLERTEDNSEEVRMAAMRAILKIWDALNSGRKASSYSLSAKWQSKLVRFLKKVESREELENALELLELTVWKTPQRLNALNRVMDKLEQDKADDWKIRQAAAEWLKSKSVDILENDGYATYRRVTEALKEAKEVDPDADVRNSATSALNKYWQDIAKLRFDKLKSTIRSDSESEDERTKAIRRLADPLTLGSREAITFLVGEWVGWICNNLQPHLVEITAEAIRNNQYAVLPLVEHFVRETGNGSQMLFIGRPLKEVFNRFSQAKSQDDYLQERQDFENRLRVRKRISKQLADMSDPRYYDDRPAVRAEIIDQIRKHAVPSLVRLLPLEEDLEILENIARTLGFSRQREGINALSQAVVGHEREINARKKLLAEYYLNPSKELSEQAAMILKKAVSESRRTLRILQVLNVAVFVVGLAVLLFGLLTILTSEDNASLVVGGLASIGGLGGVLVQLVREPLNRIQNAMSNLLQLETAFTSFIWELTLNGTYIQSQYIADGKLDDSDIVNTADRIENAMRLALDLVSIYADEGNQRLVTRIHKVDPVADQAGGEVRIFGQHLQGDKQDKKEQTGLIAINHQPILLNKENLSWEEDQVVFQLPPETEGETIWISLIVDGMETNALPFHILNGSSQQPEPTLDEEI